MLPRCLALPSRVALKRLSPGVCGWLLLACVAGPDDARAINIAGYSSAANDRFSSGYTANPVTNPVPNTNPLFIGLNYDWSGVGWSDSDLTKSFGMLSPRHYLLATHYGGAGTVQFLGRNGQLYLGTQQSVRGTGLGPADGDVSLGTLTKAIPAQSAVAFYSILDLVPSTSNPVYNNYVGQNLLMYGKTGRVANNATDQIGISGSGYYISCSATQAGYQIGDSGSPIFLSWTDPVGVAHPAILGAAWAVDNLDAPTRNYESFIPESAVAAKLNEFMAVEGYALRWVGNPATLWNGNTGNRFDRRFNWSAGQVPSDVYALFDGTATSQRSIALMANQNLRGLIFNNVPGNNGFVFQTGSVLTVGRGGIINYDADNVQTLQCDVALASPQWWDGRTGGLSVSGSLNNNGNLLVVDGSGNSVFAGAITGTGGLAKEGAGVLTLSGNAAFGGTLFIHNGTVNLNGAAGNSYAGGTMLLGGVLLANNSTGSATGTGGVTVASGAVLGGSGLFAPTGTNNVTINGTLSPGDDSSVATFRFDLSSGRLVFGSDGTLVLNTGTSADLVQFSNDQVTLSGTLKIVPGSGFSYSQTYKIFSGLNAVPTGSFNAVTGVAAGFNVSFSYNAGDYLMSFVPATFATWQQTHFTETEISGGQAGSQMDPDADGIPNLVEYALGLDPKAASTTGLPVAAVSGSYLTMTVNKNPNATDVTYSVEVTGNLGANSWSTAGTTVLVNNATTLVVRDNTTVGGANSRFMRLRVTPL